MRPWFTVIAAAAIAALVSLSSLAGPELASASTAKAVAAKKCKRHHHKRKCRKSQPVTSTAPTATVPATNPTTTVPTPPLPPSSHTLTVSNDGDGSGVVESSPAGIRCPSPSCVASFNPGTTVTLTPAPETNSHFDHWSGACTGSGPCQVTMDADKAVTAVFSLDLRTLTVQVTSNYTSATDGGAVTSDDYSLNCREASGTCSAQYPYGTTVTLKAEAAAGWFFWGWGGGTCSGFTPTCQVTMNAVRFVTADFIDS
jgi:Divergent InlB B-repeat domain